MSMLSAIRAVAEALVLGTLFYVMWIVLAMLSEIMN